MKAKIVIFMSVLIAGILILAHCKKENSPIRENEIISVNDNELIQRSLNIVERVKNFKDNLYSPSRANEEMEIDSAIWFWETTLNYDYAFPDSSYYQVIYFSSHFTTTLTFTGQVQENDVNATYLAIEDSLIEHHNSINYTFKHLVLADVKEDSIDRFTLYTTVHYVFGVNNGTYRPFGEDDYWYWGWDKGRCDSSGTGIPSDGSDELAVRLNHPNPPIGPDIRFTEIQSVLTDPFEWETINNPYGEFRIFYAGGYGSGPPDEPCMVPDELTYYLWEGHNLIYNYPPQGIRIPGKSFISITIEDSQCNSIEVWCRLHEYFVYYGEPYIYHHA